MLPPYGLFSVYHRQLASHDDPMEDWLPSYDEAERKRLFLDWRLQLRKELSELIWPFLVRNNGGVAPTWHGIDTNVAAAIVGLELNLMLEHFQADDPVINSQANVVSDPKFGRSHREQFFVEDNPVQPAAVNLRDHVKGLSKKQYEDSREIVDKAYKTTKLPGLFWFKSAFMRTRPYQAALIFGKDDFQNYPALSARHSSFYSGHCLEGIIFSAAIDEFWQSRGKEYSLEQFDQLSQYAVDFGDRRVFAGVHFPTDNVGSWIIALRLSKLIFKDSDRAFGFISRAITQKSAVFKLIEATYSEHEALSQIRAVLIKELEAGSSVA